MFCFASDENASVRLSFIWSSKNIAANTPDNDAHFMPVFERLLHDADDRVRMEAPGIFRVHAKRRPDFDKTYTADLRRITETDNHCIVRIQCLGAIKAFELHESRRSK